MTVQNLTKNRLALAVTYGVDIDSADSFFNTFFYSIAKQPHRFAFKRYAGIKHIAATLEKCLLRYNIDIGIFCKIGRLRLSGRDIGNAGTAGSVGRGVVTDLVHQQFQPVFGYYIFPGFIKGGIRVYGFRFQEIAYILPKHLGVKDKTAFERLLLK